MSRTYGLFEIRHHHNEQKSFRLAWQHVNHSRYLSQYQVSKLILHMNGKCCFDCILLSFRDYPAISFSIEKMSPTFEKRMFKIVGSLFNFNGRRFFTMLYHKYSRRFEWSYSSFVAVCLHEFNTFKRSTPREFDSNGLHSELVKYRFFDWRQLRTKINLTSLCNIAIHFEI